MQKFQLNIGKIMPAMPKTLGYRVWIALYTIMNFWIVSSGKNDSYQILKPAYI